MTNEEVLERCLNQSIAHAKGQCSGMEFPHKHEECIRVWKEEVLRRMKNFEK